MLIKPIQIEIPTYGTMTYVWTRPYEEKQVCFTTLATAAVPSHRLHLRFPKVFTKICLSRKSFSYSSFVCWKGGNAIIITTTTTKIIYRISDQHIFAHLSLSLSLSLSVFLSCSEHFLNFYFCRLKGAFSWTSCFLPIVAFDFAFSQFSVKWLNVVHKPEKVWSALMLCKVEI